MIYGTKENPVRDIGFERLRLRIHAPREAVARGAGGNFDLRWTATNLAGAVFAHDIPAVYGRYLAGLKVRGLDIEWDRDLPGYFSNALSCEDFAGLDLEDFSARQAAPDSPHAVILLRNGSAVSIRDSVARAGAGTFLSLSEVSGLGLFVNNDVAAASRVFDPERVRLYGLRKQDAGRGCRGQLVLEVVKSTLISWR